jgi:hypothetical protein
VVAEEGFSIQVLQIRFLLLLLFPRLLSFPRI